jgi:Na+-translocating ferredoxin:NAD+ oxidoreductase RnfA subunit
MSELAKLIPPKYTTPLTKLIRTLEGILVLIACAVLVVAAIVNDISPDLAAKLGTGLVAVTTASRTLLKAFANKNPNALLPILEPIGTADEVGDSDAVVPLDQQSTQEFSAIASVPEYYGDEAPAAEEPVDQLLPRPVYDYESEPVSIAPTPPQTGDTPESRGEDPNL